MTTWHLFKGQGDPSTVDFPAPPPWRRFAMRDAPLHNMVEIEGHYDSPYWNPARTYRTPMRILDAINAALTLRRPLLLTGRPGSGKSSLIYRVAYELSLGPVLVWPVNSRTTLKDGLYDYDAIARLQERRLQHDGDASAPQSGSEPRNMPDDIGRFITLRALGTALLPSSRPRALLIDEIDKADPDLPNDLLNILEDGWFEIPELQRHESPEVQVRIADPIADRADKTAYTVITRGRVSCAEFPFIVMTSNGEREFPQAFQRRCIRVDLAPPTEDDVCRIVAAHLGESVAQDALGNIQEFVNSEDVAATDQLLNALYIVHALNGGNLSDEQRIKDLLMRPLT
ncbi:AAA family ATPase [Paraburkholderia caribensis]|uniref:AAA family ATPase n=1 Tax=Paraburkholderia caribensis TaxID=75105 RepID=A0A9Q6WNZ7_9BURK|nr:AAA family ATPase [Paraburkholderia caribensis]MCO4882976.1 AAA family ATPase [Paraburkholderia caribensis]PTB30680.1 AAA family ATPase [Paraburkholderia caribensis]QLB65583.1 hypothetical protein A9O66_24725 [Paraburkholderia caribensis]